MELAVTKLAVICFLVTGVSHIVQPRVWAQFFIDLRSKGEIGSFHNGLLHFPLGALIVSFHNVWHGLPMVLTIIGWGLLLKSLIYLTFPRHGVKMLERVSLERSWIFVVGGGFSIGISGLLIFSLLRR